MRNKDTSHLDSKQLQNRFKILGLLHKYWKSESFPINTTRKQRIPQIMDQNGTMCAVAYVMYNSGHQNLVSHLAQNHNYVLIDDVPDDHELIGSLEHNGISKKEAARIQPSYSCHAIVGPIHVGDPIVEFLGIILSIAGLATALSFSWGLNHILYNINKRTVVIVIILGVIATGGGFGMLYQNSIAEPFTDTDFSGTRDTVSVIDDVLLYYWIDGGTVEETQIGLYFKIIPDRDGTLVVAYPPILTKGYSNYYNDNYFENVLVSTGYRAIEPLVQSHSTGYTILKIPFNEDDTSIGMHGPGLCHGFIFD